VLNFRDAQTDVRTHGRTEQNRYTSGHSTFGGGIKTVIYCDRISLTNQLCLIVKLDVNTGSQGGHGRIIEDESGFSIKLYHVSARCDTSNEVFAR